MRLDIEQDARFQQREWRIERVGWVLLSLFVLAGLLGSGPMSRTTAHGPSGAVQVEYHRVTHHEADDSILIRVGPDGARDGTVRIEVTGSWVTGVDRQGLAPQPAEERLVPGGSVLELPVDRPGPTEVTVSFRAQHYGALTADVAAAGERVSFTQIVLP